MVPAPLLAAPALAAAPTLDPLSAATVQVCDTLAVPVVVGDVDGDALTVSVDPWPAGARLVTDGGGRWMFLWAPTDADVRTWTLVVEASDGVSVATAPLVVDVVPGPAPGVEVVVTAPDDLPGPGVRLRDAITFANANPGRDVVRLDPSLDGQNLGAGNAIPLPAITEAVVLDGTDAPTALYNGLGVDPGLEFTAACNVVRGLTVTNFAYTPALRFTAGGNLVEDLTSWGSGLAPIEFAQGSHGNTVADSLLETNAGAVVAVGSHGNVLRDTTVTGGAPAIDLAGIGNVVGPALDVTTLYEGVRFGGVSCWANDVVALTAFGGAGLTTTCPETHVLDSTFAASAVVFAGDAGGSTLASSRLQGRPFDALVRSEACVWLEPGPSTGAPVEVRDTVVVECPDGVRVTSVDTPVGIYGSFFGLDRDGTPLLPNTVAVHLLGARDVTVGDLGVDGNQLLGSGIFVDGDRGNVFVNNQIDAGSNPAIDLAPYGWDANDALDADGGPNDGQNHPVLGRVVSVEDETTVEVALHSTPSTVFEIELYAAGLPCDERADGSQVLAEILDLGAVSTDAAGDGAVTLTLPTALPNGTPVVATVTGPGGTSELSACVSSVATRLLPVTEVVVVNDDDPTTTAGRAHEVTEIVVVGDAPDTVPGQVLPVPEVVSVADAPAMVPGEVVSVPETVVVRDAPRPVAGRVLPVDEKVIVHDDGRAVPEDRGAPPSPTAGCGGGDGCGGRGCETGPSGRGALGVWLGWVIGRRRAVGGGRT